MKPDAFGYSWWYKAVRIARDEPEISTPLHPDVKGQRRLDAVLKAVNRAFREARKEDE